MKTKAAKHNIEIKDKITFEIEEIDGVKMCDS